MRLTGVFGFFDNATFRFPHQTIFFDVLCEMRFAGVKGFSSGFSALYYNFFRRKVYVLSQRKAFSEHEKLP